MKNFNKYFLLFLISIFSNAFAQDYSFKNYDWGQPLVNYVLPEQYKNDNQVTIEKNIKIEFVVANKMASQYYLLHEKIYINSDDAIERNNKVYIPFSLNESVLINKLRVILKNGKIIPLDNKDIKEEVDEERGVKYNFFAVTGLEKGAIIEKMYVILEKPELDGKTLKMQSEYPIITNNFDLIYPKHLVFKTKSYNGLSEPKIDETTIEGKHKLSIQESNIVGLDDNEKYGNWNANVKFFRYKLDQNLITGAKNLYNFKEFGTNLYNRMNPVYDKKELKEIVSFSKNIKTLTDTQAQIWEIENAIKKTINYSKYAEMKENIAEVIKSKQANETDLLKVYVALFKQFNIEHQIVFTSDRTKILFDKDFESFENLSETLFYFPTISKYISPTTPQYRIPFFPADYGNNYGLFIKEKKFAGVSMGISEFSFVAVPGIDVTHDTMDIVVDFTKDFENPTISNTITFGGYAGLNLQPIKDYVSAEEYKEVLKSIAENYAGTKDYKTLVTENDGIDNIGKKPFVLKISFEGKDMIQKAGENYLFSVGLIIGKQLELYQENKRILPVEIDYPHAYTRNIKIVLPKGATAKNLEKFNMNFKTTINGKDEAIWTSSFTKTDNEIKIQNIENYNIIDYPLSVFDQYKAVINAAADFNKIVIILNK